MACKACKERGKTWDGDDPKCAFEHDVFSYDNWNCATMSLLRNHASLRPIYNEDQYLGVMNLECGAFLVLTWYKSRGRCDGAIIIDEAETIQLDCNMAINILDHGDWKEND